jgi:predicted aspartyl protease
LSIRRRAGIAVLVLAPAIPLHAAPAPSGGIPFAAVDGGAVIVPVLVDGRGPHPFLVDTGANRSAVSAGLARELGLAAVARMTVVTTVGEETRKVVRLGRVSVGAAEGEGLLASVVDSPTLRMDGASFDGILGQDFLSRFDYTIDYDRHLLVWEGPATTADGTRLALHPSEGRFLVDLPQPGKGQRAMRFVPDSGANALVVFERGGDMPLPAELLRRRSEITASSGRRRGVQMSRIRALQVGSLTLRDQIAAVVSRDGNAPAGDGLLPLHQFASVTFRSRAGYMVVQAR